MSTEAEKQKTFALEKGHELRIEVKQDKVLLLKLIQGQAEIFGTELSLGEQLSLKGQKLAVYTWLGCVVELAAQEGDVNDAMDVVYESDETPMVSYLNVHDALEQRRRASREAGTSDRPGPRTIVVGPTDSGKSSLARILLNYAVRAGWAPTAVDLDIGQGSITVPGAIAATPVEAPIDVEEGTLPADVPLVYFYGHASPSEGPELYAHLVERLAAVLERRANVDVQAAGCVINTMGWVEGLGYDLLVGAIDALKADVVLVVGQERLYNQLLNHLRPRAGVSVVRLHSSGGVVARSPAVRKAARTQRVREYFYGPRGDLSPHSQTVRWDELALYAVGGGPRAPTSALPIGAASVVDPLRLAPVAPSLELLNCLVAVSHAAAPEQLLHQNVAGFLHVSDVDVVARTLTYLAPCPGPLPGRFLLTGNLKVFFE